jgi:hypothetical protein
LIPEYDGGAPAPEIPIAIAIACGVERLDLESLSSKTRTIPTVRAGTGSDGAIIDLPGV